MVKIAHPRGLIIIEKNYIHYMFYTYPYNSIMVYTYSYNKCTRKIHFDDTRKIYMYINACKRANIIEYRSALKICPPSNLCENWYKGTFWSSQIQCSYLFELLFISFHDKVKIYSEFALICTSRQCNFWKFHRQGLSRLHFALQITANSL